MNRYCAARQSGPSFGNKREQRSMWWTLFEKPVRRHITGCSRGRSEPIGFVKKRPGEGLNQSRAILTRILQGGSGRSYPWFSPLSGQGDPARATIACGECAALTGWPGSAIEADPYLCFLFDPIHEGWVKKKDQENFLIRLRRLLAALACFFFF